MTYVNAIKLPRVDIITISISEETRTFAREESRF